MRRYYVIAQKKQWENISVFEDPSRSDGSEKKFKLKENNLFKVLTVPCPVTSLLHFHDIPH